LAVLDALGCNQSVGNLLNDSSLPSNSLFYMNLIAGTILWAEVDS